MAVPLPAPDSGSRWTPPRLTHGLAADFAVEVRRVREALADVRHSLERYDQGGTDDPAAMAARDIAGCLPELDSAVRWLTEEV